MERFAVVCQPDDGKRIIKSHPMLRRLPEGIANKCISFISVQKTGIILDRESGENLGCLLDVPGFFGNWDQLEMDKRRKTIDCIARTLKKSGISVLCFPLVSRYFSAEEIQFLNEQGIDVLDGYHHRLAGMLLVLKQLLLITKKDVPQFETGIWGADTDAGRVWAAVMAEEVNHMCIGGRDYMELERLAYHILKTTGLACQITDKPEVCISNKNIAVLSQPVEASFSLCRPSFLFHSYRYEYHSEHPLPEQAQALHRVYNIDMGWLSFPHDLDIKPPPGVWEELGVLEGLFYTASRVYRNDILNNRITLNQMNRLLSMYEMYPIKLQGFAWNGKKINFDRFRKSYFG
ncbi:MAG TPA: hypothetical protein GX505_04660 [Clostridiales bacterium]|nr:hypothetical protein [Clostridiales bacterium]